MFFKLWLYVCNGLLRILSAFVPALVQLCEAFTLCVFRPVHFLELAAAWPVIKFHWPSTIMMKWRPVMLAPLISVTLVAHMSTAVRGPTWPLASERLATTRWPLCESSSEYIRLIPCCFIFCIYILKCIRLILIKHVSELPRSLELTIWSDLIPGAHWLPSAAVDVLERRNHSLLIAQFK